MWIPYQKQFRYPQNFQQQYYNKSMQKTNGIHFEPFNKNDLEKIKSSVQNKCDANKIATSIQNEYNASVFYQNLISQTNNQMAIQILNKIETNCQYRKNILDEIYQSQTQAKFEIKNAQINKINNLSNGINFAIRQENHCAQNLLEILNEINDTQTKNKINFIFNQKLLDINYLIYIAQTLYLT